MLRRSLTGLILGIVMISGLLYSIWTAALLFLVILIYSSMEWYQHFITREGSFTSRIYILIICLFSILLIANLFNNHIIQEQFNLQKTNGFLLLILAVFGFSIVANKKWAFAQSWYSGIFYICFPILIGFIYINDDFSQHKWIILGLIIINWSNDVFAYFTGKLFGKHLLAPDISPKKTLEGAFGGLVAAILAAWLVNTYLFKVEFPHLTVIILGISIWLSGTLGDLYESKLKRIIGIKDSGQLLPGHGGFLDRFDSFFFIIPVGIFVLSF